MNFLNKLTQHNKKSKNIKMKKLKEQNISKFRKILTFKTLLEWLKKKSFISYEQTETLKTINVTTKDLNSQYWKHSNKVTKQQYSPELQKFAMTLHYYSSTAYKYVRSILNLSIPHPHAVQKWYKSIVGSPGFTTEYLEVLKLLANKTKGPVYCCLMMDEMEIREKIEVDGDKIHGHVDFGIDLDSDTVPNARGALIFLVTSITNDWKVPVGYFLIDTTTSQQRADLVLQYLKHLYDSNISVVGLTFDLCLSNFAMARILGCNLNPNDDMKTTFKHPVTKKPVAVFFDTCKIIILVTMSLQSCEEFVTTSGKSISWAHVENLNRLKNTEYFKLQLRKHHMKSQHQNVKGKLETQLFSKSIADSLDFCREELKIAHFIESLATAEFIRLMNDLFDLLNSRNLQQVDYKQPLNLKNKNKVMQFFNYAENYIKCLQTPQGEFLIQSKNSTGLTGCLVCIKSTKVLFQQFVEKERIKFMAMHRFSQDHLKLFFFNAHMNGGRNMSNPTTRQFKTYYRKLLDHLDIKTSNDNECIKLQQIAELNCSSPLQIINATRGRLNDEDLSNVNKWSRIKSLSDFDRFCYTLPEMPEFGDQFIIYYTTGYVVKTLEKIIECDECNRTLSSQNPQTGHAFYFDYMTFYDNHDSVYPSEDAFKICKVAELEIQEIIKKSKNVYIRPSLDKSLLINKVLRFFINSNIFDSILIHQFDQSPTENHLVNLVKAIADAYVDMRFRYLTMNMRSAATTRQFFDNMSLISR